MTGPLSMAPSNALQSVVRARGWVLDVDGCLVRTKNAGGVGGTAIPGAAELLRWLRDHGRDVIVCTNASQHTVASYASHLRSLGLDVRDDEMMTAASAAALHVATRHPAARVLALGDEGLEDALRAQGIGCVQPGGPLADVVVVGGADSYTTAALDAACRAVADNGAALYVTVDSRWFHGGLGRSVSSSSAIAAAISWVTGRTAEVCGKPSPALAAVLLDRLGTPGSQIVVVGDGAQFEMKLAHLMGAHGVLVLSGGTSRSELDGLAPDLRPHLHVDDVGALFRLISNENPTGDRHDPDAREVRFPA